MSVSSEFVERTNKNTADYIAAMLIEMAKSPTTNSKFQCEILLTISNGVITIDETHLFASGEYKGQDMLPF